MRIYNYKKKDKEEIEKRLTSYKLSLEMLLNFSKGFETIGQVWDLVSPNGRATQKELDKFANLIKIEGYRVEARKDSWSWDWHKKWSGDSRQVNFFALKVENERVLERHNVLTVYLSNEGKVKQHYCANSLNVETHTIKDLINGAQESISRLTKALNLYYTVDQRITDYTEEIEQAAIDIYNKHLNEIEAVIESYS